MQLGTFQKTKDGYEGAIRTLKVTINDVRIVKIPGQKKSEKSPDYRVLAEGGVEVGAGWNKAYGEGKKNTFISVLIDDQSLERPITGSVFDNKDGRSAQMVWSRPSRS